MNSITVIKDHAKATQYTIKYWAFLVIASGLVLHPVLFNGFAQRLGDDDWMLYENPLVRSLDWNNIAYYFTHFYTGQYSPINTLYYSIIYQLFGLEPFWYHLFSLVLHAINAILVGTFIRRILILRSEKHPTHLDGNRIDLIAFSTALLFAIHPMQVESVAWISASKNLLYTCFSLLALLQYMRYTSSGRWMPYAVTALSLYVLAFGSKEQATILPVSMLLVDWYAGRDMRRWRYWLSVLPFFVLAIGMGLVSLQAQDSGFSARLANEYYPFWQRIVVACFAFTEYIFKGLLPIKLNFMYSFPMKPGEAMPLVYWFYPVVIVCLGLLLVYAWGRGRRSLFFGLGFLVTNLVLALHIVPMARGVVVADRYFYLAGIGLFFIVSRYVLGSEKLTLSWLRVDTRLLLGIYSLYIGVFAWQYAVNWT